MNNVMHKFSSMCLFLFVTLYMFRAHSAHHQERQIVSIQPLVTVILCWWLRCVQVGRRRWSFTKNHYMMHGQQYVKEILSSSIMYFTPKLPATCFGLTAIIRELTAILLELTAIR